MKISSNFWKKILLSSLRLSEGSCVVIDGYREQLDELESLAAECYVQGIYPLLKLSLSQESLKQISRGKPPENLKPKHLLAILDGIDAWISVYGWAPQRKDKRKIIDYPPEYQPSGEVLERMAEKKVKFALIMLPPPKEHPLATVVKDAFNCNYSRIRLLGRKLQNALRNSEDTTLKTKAGSSLQFSVKDRAVLVEDGVLDEEDLKQDFILSLPAGVACFSPIETSVNGVVFVKRAKEYNFGMGILKDATLRFEKGRLVDWKAKKGGNVIKRFLKRVKGTSDTISEVCIGINEKVRNYVGLPNIDELRYGCADIAIGHNAPFGKSKTKPPIHWHFPLGKIELLKTKEKVIVKEGHFL
jgi:leucyl aminopeptidase (aminopeptidase T)